jgi:hypothetical protein
MEAARSSKTLVSYHITTWHHNPDGSKLNKLQVFEIKALRIIFGLNKAGVSVQFTILYNNQLHYSYGSPSIH